MFTFCGVKFPNPFCLSSSPVGNCYEMCAKAYDTGWGGVVFKTIGFFIANEVSPRFDHLVKEDTGFIGFKNMEQIAEHPLEENLAALRRLKEDYPDKVLIASIMGENEQQWEELARLVQEAGADMIECNFSCPQMTSHAMGSDVGQSPELVEKYCRAVKRGSTLPMLAKMTPNIGDMCEVALAAKRGGADGIAAINTVKSITNIDLNQKIGMPIVNGKSSISGYSGKAVKPIALRFIQQMRTHPAHGQCDLRGAAWPVVGRGRGLCGLAAAQSAGSGQPDGLPRQHVRRSAVRPDVQKDPQSPRNAVRRGLRHRHHRGTAVLSHCRGLYGCGGRQHRVLRLCGALPGLHRGRLHSGRHPGIHPPEERCPQIHAGRIGALIPTEKGSFHA